METEEACRGQKACGRLPLYNAASGIPDHLFQFHGGVDSGRFQAVIVRSGIVPGAPGFRTVPAEGLVAVVKIAEAVV